MEMGNRLRQVRKENKFTQTEIAKRLNVSQRTVSSWETDRTIPTLGTLNKLCSLYDCTYEYLTGMKQHDINDISVDDVITRLWDFSLIELNTIKKNIDNIIDHKQVEESVREQSDLLRRLLAYKGMPYIERQALMKELETLEGKKVDK